VLKGMITFDMLLQDKKMLVLCAIAHEKHLTKRAASGMLKAGSLAVLCQPLNERKNAFFSPHFMKAQNTPLSPVKLPFFGRSDRA
jgi:hypothetical protein